MFSLTRTSCGSCTSSNQVLYVYHNRIDATGDKPGTERQVFEAAEDTLRELVDLVKRLTNANATNILITADHGFLFQDTALADAFYLSTRPQGDEIMVTNRRYVLGRGLKEDTAFTTFTSAQLGLDSDLEVQIPKSIHRLRLPGAGSVRSRWRDACRRSSCRCSRSTRSARATLAWSTSRCGPSRTRSPPASSSSSCSSPSR